MNAKDRWRIGDLAQATGLTVRTLHHYEHLGLLAPGRTEGNQRLYDADDVRRLYRIRALRELGLSLEEIGRAIDGGGGLSEALSLHLERAEAEIRRLTILRDRLRHVCATADAPAEDLLGVIEAMSRVAGQAARRPTSAEEAQRWRALGDELRACMNRGEGPTSPAVRELAAQAREGMRRFAQGDPETVAALAEIRRVAPPQELAGWDPPLFRFLDEALKALEEP